MAQKILIVDDQPYMQRLVQLHLERAGYEVIKASNGREAIEVTAHEIPQLIILDFMIPEMNGMEVLNHLKGEAATRSIPVIMITANSCMISRQEAESSGAALFLTKPFSPTQLLEEIKRLVPETKRA